MRRLLVLGSAPCLQQDLSGLDMSAYDVAAVNRAGIQYLGPIRWWVSYHPTTMAQERWLEQRNENQGNTEFSIVLHHRCRWVEKKGYPIEFFPGPSTTGSSTLLAVLFGLHSQRYDAVLVAGAPLEEPYDTFRGGWIEKKRVLAGRVRSLSGWTQIFLEGLNHGA